MLAGMTLLIFYVFLVLCISFVCSIMEAVLLSVTPQFVAQVESENASFGRRLRRFKDEIDRPLAAILSLNTIAHTVGAAGAGAQAMVVFGDMVVGVVSAVLTFLILVFSEIIPKTLGAVYWRQLTPLVIRLLVPTIWCMYPLVKLSEGMTALLSRGKERELVSREEFKSLAKLGAREGILHEDESRIMQNLFRLRQVKSRDIMTPRTVMCAFKEELTVGQIMSENEVLRFSRFPVYGNDLDDVSGFILKSDVLLNAAKQQNGVSLKDLKLPIMILPGSLPIQALLDNLIQDSAHISLVVDEYGGTEGIVTMEDVLETLLGLEIVDEADKIKDMQAFARKQWRKRALKLGIIQDSDQTF
jgi:magnesium and cobalt exporter, CNNM family